MIKKRNLAQRAKDADRYILSTLPVLWVPMTEGHHSDGSTFLSSDGIGHLCTVTGATWGIQGRTFNGSDSVITLSDALLPDWAVDWTMIAWASLLTGVSDYGGIVSNRIGTITGWVTLGTRFGTIQVERGNGGLEYIASAYDARDTGFHQYIVEKSGSTITLYIDLVSKGTIDATGDIMGDSNNQFMIGRWFGDTSGWKGIISEVDVITRALSAGERMRMYQVIKGRYQ